MAKNNNLAKNNKCGRYIPPFDMCDIKNKRASAQFYIESMLNRTQSIFKYNNLPDTIPQRILERSNQTYGFTFWVEYNNNLYALWGGLGGEPDEYLEPTICVVANPYLKLNKEYNIKEDGVLMRNDSQMLGLLPLFNRYAYQLAENDITLNIADINMRKIMLIAAPDDRTKKSAELYLDQVEQGKQGVIADNAFLDGIRVHPMLQGAGTGYITQLIEWHQYLKANWYNDIGIDHNYNMKRESLNDGEAAQNEPSLLPLIDNMLYERKVAIDKINKKYGLNISVELASAWKIEQEVQEVVTETTNENTETEQEEESNENIE